MRKTWVVPFRRMWIIVATRRHAMNESSSMALLVGVDKVGTRGLQAVDPVEMERLGEVDRAPVGAGGH